MVIVKSFSVGNGDMFYIKHASSNFTIIDCCLKFEDDEKKNNSERIIAELKREASEKNIVRFISTHPDDDHIGGLKKLYEQIEIPNFYCVKNNAIKDEKTDDFQYYCTLRDGTSSFYIYKDCQRCWMNKDDNVKKYGSSGIHILWPNTSNSYFKEALEVAARGGKANNISPIIKYKLENGITALWLGDMEKDFLNKVENDISWPPFVDIIFAPHHGRDSGKISEAILNKINPKLIIIGEASSEYLNYYQGWNTITQNTARDITFECETHRIHVFVSNDNYNYPYDNLIDEGKQSGVKGKKYIGSLATGEQLS